VIKKELKGQITVEFIFLISLLIIISLTSISLISQESELNIAISAARNGIIEGIVIDGVGIYPKSSFDSYITGKNNLLKPNSIMIDKIVIRNTAFDAKYNKTRVQLQVYVISESVKDKKDQSSLGDRINYNLRKSISHTFNTSHLSNSLYNPSYSNNYIFTTADVVWQ